MKLFNKDIKKYYGVFAALGSMGILLLALSYAQMLSNGKYAFASDDLFTQVASFSHLLISKIKEGSNLYYSFKAGLGMNTSLLFAFYATSPFNLLYFFSDGTNINIITIIVYVLKVGTAAFGFWLFSKYNLKYNHFFSILISISYSLMAFGLNTIHMNVLYDGVYMLPFVFVGVKYCVDKSKIALLSFIYFILFLSNFYGGYVVGVSSFVYLIYYLWRKYNAINRQCVFSFLKYTVSVIIAFMLSGFLILPVLGDVMGQKIVEESLDFNILPLWDIISYLFPFHTHTSYNIAPYSYCGLFVLILAIAFFFNKKIDRKVRIISFLAILLYVACISIKPLYMMAHMFNNPTGYTCRFVYVFGFIMCSLAIMQIKSLKGFELKKTIYVFSVLFLLTVLAPVLNNLSGNKSNSPSVLMMLVALIISILWFVYIIKLGKCDYTKNIRNFVVLGAVLCAAELCINGFVMFNSIRGTQISELDYRLSQIDELTTEMMSEDSSAYRTHYNGSINQNFGSLFDYNGTSLFSSISNDSLKEFLYNLGVCSTKFVISDYGDSDLVRILENEKYTIFPDLSSDGTGDSYIETNRVAGMGYIIGDTKENIQNLSYGNNIFENQNNVYSLLYGEKIEPYKIYEGEVLFESQNVEISTNENGEFVFTFDTSCADGFVTIKIPSVSGYEGCVWISQGYNDIYKNSVIISSPLNKYICGYKKRLITAPSMIQMSDDGEYNYIHLLFNADTYPVVELRDMVLAYYDSSYAASVTNKLSENGFITEVFEDGNVSGTVNCNESGVLFFSIPYDKGWNAYIDGQSCEIIPLFNGAFTGIALEKGYHSVSFVYEAPFSKIGIICSAIGLFILISIVLIEYCIKKDFLNKYISNRVTKAGSDNTEKMKKCKMDNWGKEKINKIKEKEVHIEQNNMTDTSKEIKCDTTDTDKLTGKSSFTNIKYPALITFIFAIIIYFVAISINMMGPGGKFTFFNGDLTSITMPYYKMFIQKLLSGSNPYYSFTYGLGENVSMLKAFSGMSPFSLVYLFIKDAYIATAVMIGLKIATSATCFQQLCKHNYDENGIVSIVAGLFYGFCSYQFYLMNISAVEDCLYLLPLMFIILKKAIKEDRYYLLTIGYAACFIIQFYSGFLIGLATFAYFTIWIINNRNNSKDSIKKWVKYFASVGIAVLISGCIILPAAFRILGMSDDTISTFSFSCILPADVIASMFMGQPIRFSEPFPYIYAGIPCLLSIPLYFACKKINIKEKVTALVFISLYFISFIFKPFYLFLHMFNEPDGYTSRYSILFVFAVCVIAVKALRNRKDLSMKYGIISGGILLAVYAVVPWLDNKLALDFVFDYSSLSLLINIVLVVIWIFVITFKSIKDDTKISLIFLLCIIELILNTTLIFSSLKASSYTIEEYTYYDEIENVLSTEIKNTDDSVYRVSYLDSYTLNPGCIYGLPTVTSFGSTYNGKMFNTLYKMGIGVHDFYSTVYGNNDVTDMLLGVKYYFDMGYPDSTDTYSFGINKRFISLGYMVDEKARDIELGDDPFMNLNNILSGFTGQDVTVFVPYAGYCNVESTGAVIVADEASKGFDVIRENLSEFEWVTLTIPDNNGMRAFSYFANDVNRAYGSSPTVYSISDKYQARPLLSYASTPHVVEMEKNEEFNGVSFLFYPDTDDSIHINSSSFSYLDETVLDDVYRSLSDEALNITTFEDGIIEGTVNAGRDGILFLAVSYDEAWKIYVDGIETQVIPMLDNSFCGVSLTEGSHQIVMKYETKGGTLGLIMTILGSAIILVWLFMVRRKK